MALAGRSARRGGAGARWLALGIAITLLVLLVDAAVKSRSSGPSQQLAAGAWIDRVLPIVDTSTQEGQQVAALWAHALSLPAPTLTSELEQLASGARSAYEQAVALDAPAQLDGPAGLLEACLFARSEAANALEAAFQQALGGSALGSGGVSAGAVSPLQLIEKAGTYLQVGDQAYQLFSTNVPRSVAVKMPPSTWLTTPAPYQPQAAQVFLDSLRSATTTTPVHQVKIYLIATDPPPVANHGSTEVLPDATAITVTIVVADVGNQTEDNLTVTAAISSSSNGASSARDFVNLSPGEAHTIIGLGPLDPVQGVPVTLTVTVSPPPGTTTATVTRSVLFTMPGPPPTTTKPGGTGSTGPTSTSSTTLTG